MSPDLGEILEAARDLAWRPTANTHRRAAYHARRESHERLVELLKRTYVGPQRDPILNVLVAAIRRVAACTFSNRYGLAYYERKVAMAELRGCLVVFDREVVLR